MKLVDVCEFYTEHGGGVRTYIHQKLAASAAAGVDCTILAPGAEDRIEARPGGRIQYLKSPRHFIDARYHVFKNSAPVFAALDQLDPDVVEGSSAWRGGELAAAWPGPAARAFFIHQDPVAVYGHTILGRIMSFDAVDSLASGFWGHLGRLAARYDVSVVSGAWLAERLARMGLPRPFASPFGIEKSVFSPQLRDEALRRDMLRQTGCDEPEGLLLIAVSRYHPEKRIGMLIDAFEAIRATHPAGLWVIGHGPIRRWVEGRARRAAGVHLPGPIWERTKLAAMLASADVFLHGGAAETFGLAVAEGLASGLPLIVPDLGGASDLAGPGYAISYQAGNTRACAAAITQFLARDRGAMRASALADGAAKLRDPKAHFDDLFGLYARLPRRTG